MAVIGCGPIGILHAQAVAGSPEARLIAVCDIDNSRAQVLARNHEVRSYASVTDLLAAESLDAVCVATPDHLHAAAGLLPEALQNGEDKGKRLAGAGLGCGDDVAAGQRRLDRLLLDGCRLLEAVACQVALQHGRNRKFRKLCHSEFEKENRRANYR